MQSCRRHSTCTSPSSAISILIYICVGIRASPRRLLLLFKGLAAPSPLKQKEKRDWVRLRPSDQNTSSKAMGGKAAGCGKRSQILHRSTGDKKNPLHVIEEMFFFNCSAALQRLKHIVLTTVCEIYLIELWIVAFGSSDTDNKIAIIVLFCRLWESIIEWIDVPFCRTSVAL